MLLPCTNGIFEIRANGVENRVPHFVHLLVGRNVREDLGSPIRGSVGNAGPAHFIGLLILPVFRHGCAICTLVIGNALRIHAFKQVRVRRENRQESSSLLGKLGHFLRIICRRLQKSFVWCQIIPYAVHNLITVIHLNLLGARFISFFTIRRTSGAASIIALTTSVCPGCTLAPTLTASSA